MNARHTVEQMKKKKREVVHRLNQLSQENKNTNNKFNVQMVG